MPLRTRVHRIEGTAYIDMYMPVTEGTQWLARAVWPDDMPQRPAVIAELLRHIGKAVTAGHIPVEAFNVPTT